MNNIVKLRLLFFVITQVRCSFTKNTTSINYDNLYEMSNKIIMYYIAQTDSTNQRQSNNFYIDSTLVYRPTLPPIFLNHEKYEIMLDTYSNQSFLISIPDSLKGICKYYPGEMKDVLADTVGV